MLGEEDVIISILKACGQGVVFPTSFQLKRALQHLVLMKDKQDGWSIKIRVSSDQVTVVHTKVDVSADTPSFSCDDPTVEVTWQLVLTISMKTSDTVALESVLFRVVDLAFARETEHTHTHDIYIIYYFALFWFSHIIFRFV